MNTSMNTVGRLTQEPHGLSMFQSFRKAAMWVPDRIRSYRKSRATYMALRDLDDHMLRDIGLSRADIVDLEIFGSNRD